MASDLNLLEFFTRLKAEESIDDPITDIPKLDLDLYINNYTGRTRFDRLIHIACTSTHLCVDALKAAVAEALRGSDIDNYKLACKYLQIAAPQEPLAVLDDEWILRTKQDNDTALKTLQSELEQAREVGVPESVRLSQEELARFYEKTGSRLKAIDAFRPSRAIATMAHHPMESIRCQMRVCLSQKEYTEALSMLQKAPLTITEDRSYFGSIDALRGLCFLGLGRYNEATRCFLRIELQTTQAAENSSRKRAPLGEFSDALTQNDVAVYGGLLALATRDRANLDKEVLNNTAFRSFMTNEPYIRRAITLYVGCRYAACLEILESYRTDYMLDMHLRPHVDVLLFKIRVKCITQFCVPFLSVSFKTLNKEFGSQDRDVVEEVATMIENGDLPDGRLDMESGYLENYPLDTRIVTLDKVELLQQVALSEIDEHLRIISGRMNAVASMESLNPDEPEQQQQQQQQHGGALNEPMTAAESLSGEL